MTMNKSKIPYKALYYLAYLLVVLCTPIVWASKDDNLSNTSKLELIRVGSNSSFADLGGGTYEVSFVAPKNLFAGDDLPRINFVMVGDNNINIQPDKKYPTKTRVSCDENNEGCLVTIQVNFAKYNLPLADYKSYIINIENSCNTENILINDTIPELEANLGNYISNIAVLTLKNISPNLVKILGVKSLNQTMLNISNLTANNSLAEQEDYQVELQSMTNNGEMPSILAIEINYQIAGQEKIITNLLILSLKYEYESEKGTPELSVWSYVMLGGGIVTGAVIALSAKLLYDKCVYKRLKKIFLPGSGVDL